MSRVDDLLSNHGELLPEDVSKQSTESKRRSRTGCLNCRKKRRKCDELKPTCEGCLARKEACRWGVKLSFRPENALTVDACHPSMRKAAAGTKGHNYQIIDVTKEVIRDYFEESVPDFLAGPTACCDSPVHLSRDDTQDTMPPNGHDSAASEKDCPGDRPHLELFTSQPGDDSPPNTATSISFPSPQCSGSTFEDGIFLPGTQFYDLSNALRTRIIATARSRAPNRRGSPVSLQEIPSVLDAIDDKESERLAHLDAEQEHLLWANYIQEVAPWLDKFDNARHFELVLPILAKHNAHMRYAILALSARQLELKYQQADKSCSLALYQHAIHLLSPLLQERTPAVLASCVILCVLEMMSCSPKAWRRHLDGCAALIQALGINGACSGLEQALFWCFARIDICGGLISSEPTLIPISKWMAAGDLITDCMMFQTCASFDMCANYIVYLTGRVLDLLCRSGKWEQRRQNNQKSTSIDANEYLGRWSSLFELLERWYLDRSDEMHPLLTISSPSCSPQRPFATLLYGNGPATSGNQMYHTAALLMLKNKPAQVKFAKKPKSILWHARQICAISMSNVHHGCWTNSIQPLWIAGQHMSHPTEHQAILDIYERIERETGWATRWRALDLKEYWGELDG